MPNGCVRCGLCAARLDLPDHDPSDELHVLARQLGRPLRLFRTARPSCSRCAQRGSDG